MKKIASCVLLALGLSATVQAGEAGLGVSMKSNEGSLYVPFRAGGRMMMEGKLDYSHFSDTSESLYSPGTRWDNTSASAGLGIFWLRPVTESGRLYAGPRVAYVRNTSEQAFSGASINGTTQGFSVTPTVGYEYFPVKNVSLGGEVGYAYTRLHGTASSEGLLGPDVLTHTASGSTVSSLILRVYF